MAGFTQTVRGIEAMVLPVRTVVVHRELGRGIVVGTRRHGGVVARYRRGGYVFERPLSFRDCRVVGK